MCTLTHPPARTHARSGEGGTEVTFGKEMEARLDSRRESYLVLGRGGNDRQVVCGRGQGQGGEAFGCDGDGAGLDELGELVSSSHYHRGE